MVPVGYNVHNYYCMQILYTMQLSPKCDDRQYIIYCKRTVVASLISNDLHYNFDFQPNNINIINYYYIAGDVFYKKCKWVLLIIH